MTAKYSARRPAIPARVGLPAWVRDHNPLGLVMAGLSVLLVTVLFLDTPLHRLAQTLDPALHRVFTWVTRIGMSDWSILLAALLCLGFSLRASRVVRRRDSVLWRNAAGMAGFVLAALLTSGVVANLFKWGLGRARPSLSDGSAPFAFDPIATSAGWASFPSGHATTIVAMAVGLGFLWPRLRLIFLSVALWVAASRVMVGAHWASDVMGGVALGAASAYALRLWYAGRGRVFVQRHGRLRARTSSLGLLFRREMVVLLARLSGLVAVAQARLLGIPAERQADHPDLGCPSDRAGRSDLRDGGTGAARAREGRS